MNNEKLRFELQQELDSKKNQKERNILGQFSTPYPLALDIARYTLEIAHLDYIDFLEPSVGSGVFYSALTSLYSVKSAVGYEIDTHYYKPFKQFWANTNLEYRLGNFLTTSPEQKFNLIIANPPYSRHHHINSELKIKLKKRILEEYGIHVSGLSGLYCYFLILSTLWLKEDGISVWLIPSEFMDVNYGTAIRGFLCSEVELLSVHRFDIKDTQFEDALVSSSVVVFRNKKPTNHKVLFSSGGSLLSPSKTIEISNNDLKPQEKWSHVFFEENTHSGGYVPLGTYFKVSRGISTGNNKFFILSKNDIERLALPMQFLIPVMPSPRYIKTDDLTTNKASTQFSELYLLSCNLPEKIIESNYPSLYKYIKCGEANKANDRYICRHRVPWYCCEQRKPSPIVMSYMGRGENIERMFRFFLNSTNSIVTNSYLMLYPKKEIEHNFSNQNVRMKVWEILNNIPKSNIMKCGRNYGGGLYKIEPKELEKLLIPSLDHLLPKSNRSLFD